MGVCKWNADRYIHIMGKVDNHHEHLNQKQAEFSDFNFLSFLFFFFPLDEELQRAVLPKIKNLVTLPFGNFKLNQACFFQIIKKIVSVYDQGG